MSKSSLLFLFILTYSLSVAQGDCQVSVQERIDLDYLKNGSLLVRLQTRNPSIAALKERGMEDQALLLEKEQARQNKELVEAFKTEYSFSSVYFFFNTDTDLLLEGKYDSITLVSDSLVADETISFPEGNFLVAELAYLKYPGESRTGFHALILKDPCLKQLDRPFPYFSRTFKSLGFRKTDEVVRILEKKLRKYEQRFNPSD
jgi:hypothetical protein